MRKSTPSRSTRACLRLIEGSGLNPAERAMARTEFERAERFADSVVTMIGTVRSALRIDVDPFAFDGRRRAK